MTAADLDARVRAALEDESSVTADAVAALAEEVARALENVQRALSELETRELDPALPLAEAEAVAAEADRTQFHIRRLGAHHKRLVSLEALRRTAEAQAEKAERYARAKAARDRCATLIRQKYPSVQGALMELLAEIAAATAAVQAANNDLPDGADYLDSPEGVAFGYPDSPAGRPVGYRPPVIAEMLIPDLGNWAAPAWPPGWNGGAQGRPRSQALDQWLATLRALPKGKRG